MLSILCSMLWGQAGGFSVGVFVGGMMMSGKHKYKREDVKLEPLRKWYLNDLENRVYPNLDRVATKSIDIINQAIARLKGATSITELADLSYDTLGDSLPSDLVTKESLTFFQRFNDLDDIRLNDNLAKAIDNMKAKYRKDVGELKVDVDTTTQASTYRGTSGVWVKLAGQANEASKTQRDKLAEYINNVGVTKNKAKAFIDEITSSGGLSATDPTIGQLTAAATLLEATPTDPALKSDVQKAGQVVVDKWVRAKIAPKVEAAFNAVAIKEIFKLDDAIEEAEDQRSADQAKEPTADQYDPNDEGKALTSPELAKESGEPGKWETLEGEQKSKRIGLTYGFSVGYEKEMNKNHAFVGGNAFAKKDNLTIKYNLEVEKGNRASFGELDAKPGYTFGVTVVAGKHLNPVFSVFGRGTFEFTKWGFTYDLKNDSPKLANDRISTQKLGNWVKQAAVGVGARYNFAPLWSAEVCYDFIPATKTTVRDFNKLGDDGRRRGYIYTSSQHRAFLKVVRFFNM